VSGSTGARPEAGESSSRTGVRWGLAVLAVAAAACGGEVSGAERGEELFDSTSLSPSALNVFSCSTCHSAAPGASVSDGDAGYRLFGAIRRPRFWGGDFDSVREAVDACLTFFMKGDPIDPEDPDFHALYEYLVSISPDDAPADPLPFTVVENVADVERGEAALGERIYERSCRRCHGEAFTAEGSILRTEINLPGITETYGDLFPGVDPSLVVIEKVRHGRFFNVGGDMPLFSREALSDDDLGDLLSYLEL
jgi:thiosulfate dehydrogenase